MKAYKTVLKKLNKCYALAEYFYDGRRHLLAAAEKNDPCYSFSPEGKMEDTLWEGPGGVMSMQRLPNQEILLATRQFYSPNDSAKADIVYTYKQNDQWITKTLCRLPFVHRFGILTRNNSHYLVACTLKSAHAFKDDWTCPGRIWTALLPDHIKEYDDDHLLEMKPLISGLYKNHGFFIENGKHFQSALVGSEQGILRVIPPEHPAGEWTTEQLLSQPVSDMVSLDMDRDGHRELVTISPFHGDTVSVFHRTASGSYEKIWELPEKMPFAHAITTGEFQNIPYVFVGGRGGCRKLLAIHQDPLSGSFITEELDHGAGPANVLFLDDHSSPEGCPLLAAANRETDEIAVYKLKAL